MCRNNLNTRILSVYLRNYTYMCSPIIFVNIPQTLSTTMATFTAKLNVIKLVAWDLNTFFIKTPICWKHWSAFLILNFTIINKLHYMHKINETNITSSNYFFSLYTIPYFFNHLYFDEQENNLLIWLEVFINSDQPETAYSTTLHRIL